MDNIQQLLMLEFLFHLPSRANTKTMNRRRRRTSIIGFKDLKISRSSLKDDHKHWINSKSQNYVYACIANLVRVYFRILLERGQIHSGKFPEGPNTNSRGAIPGKISGKPIARGEGGSTPLK